MPKILLVDDEPEIRYITRRMLEKAGYEVREAKNGQECLENLNKEIPDLILLDVMMPRPDGWEVCRRIKANVKTRNIPVVMFTVRTSEEDIVESRKCGAEAHINKPFDMEELLEIVRKMLESKE